MENFSLFYVAKYTLNKSNEKMYCCYQRISNLFAIYRLSLSCLQRNLLTFELRKIQKSIMLQKIAFCIAGRYKNTFSTAHRYHYSAAIAIEIGEIFKVLCVHINIYREKVKRYLNLRTPALNVDSCDPESLSLV